MIAEPLCVHMDAQEQSGTEFVNRETTGKSAMGVCRGVYMLFVGFRRLCMNHTANKAGTNALGNIMCGNLQ